MSISIDGTPAVARDVTIRATVRNADGSPAALAPWLGMAGHAMVVRTDGKVFMHLHPMGTGSMAAQERLLRREAGDTVNHGESQPAMAMPMDSMMTPTVASRGDVSFPVAFPVGRHVSRVRAGAARRSCGRDGGTRRDGALIPTS